MGVYLAVINKKNEPITKLINIKFSSDELEQALNIDFSRKDVYFSRNNDICLINYGRDSAFLKDHEQFYSDKNKNCALVIHGNITYQKEELCDLDFLNADQIYKIFENNSYNRIKELLIGDYSLLKIDESDKVLAFNDSLCTEHIYYSEDKNYILISNRIRLIRCFLENSHVDIENLSAIALMGSMVGCDTSVKEIKRIPQGSYIEVKNKQLYIHNNDLFFIESENVKKEVEEDFNRFFEKQINVCTNRLIASINKSSDFTFALTGGKDSRSILALMLKSQSINSIKTFTMGEPNHPDVVVAKK